MKTVLKDIFWKSCMIQIFALFVFVVFLSPNTMADEQATPDNLAGESSEDADETSLLKVVFSNTALSFFYGKAIMSHDGTYRELQDKWLGGKLDESTVVNLRLKKKLFMGYNWGPVFNKKSPMYAEVGLGYYELGSSHTYDGDKYSLSQYGYFGAAYVGLQSRELWRTSIFFQTGNALAFYRQTKFKTPTGTIKAIEETDIMSLAMAVGIQISVIERLGLSVSYWDGAVLDLSSLPTAYQIGVSYEF